MVAFDLDPGPPATIVECAEVALRLREAFEHLGLEAFPKTSGSKGMQVYVPLNTPATYARDQAVRARASRRCSSAASPSWWCRDMKKQLRSGKVFVDWSQNDEHKTTVNVYSLRARERPTVSTPLHWDEVEGGARRARSRGARLHLGRRCSRASGEHGDLFAPRGRAANRNCRWLPPRPEHSHRDKRKSSCGALDKRRPGARGSQTE